MAYLRINNTDYSNLISSLKIGYETLVSDKSGRNAAGDTTVDVINRKVKVYATLRHTTEEEMRAFLNSIKPYVITITYLDAETNLLKSIETYTSTPEPEYFTIQPSHTIYKPMSINFIQL